MKRLVIFLILCIGISSLSAAAQTSQPPSYAAGIGAYRSGDHAKAISHFKKAVKEKPNDSKSWYMLGSAYIKKGRHKDGVKAYERAVTIEPNSEENLVGLAFAYLLTRNDQAKDIARRALALNANNVDAHYLLGQIGLLNKSFNIAYERANRVIELNPNYAPAYRLKGEALLGSFAAQRGTIINPPASRTALLAEASAEFNKYLLLVKSEPLKAQLKDQIESLKAFAEYFGREDSGDTLTDRPPDPGRVPLKILSKPRPSYTDAARRGNVQGTIEVLVVFKGDGKVGSVLVIRSLGSGLDEEAVRAASQIKFVPASKNGTPISVVRTIEYTFDIY